MHQGDQFTWSLSHSFLAPGTSAAFFSSRLERDARAGIVHCIGDGKLSASAPARPLKLQKAAVAFAQFFARRCAGFPHRRCSSDLPSRLCGPPTGLTNTLANQGDGSCPIMIAVVPTQFKATQLVVAIAVWAIPVGLALKRPRLQPIDSTSQ